jgi:hypothetical protein
MVFEVLTDLGRGFGSLVVLCSDEATPKSGSCVCAREEQCPVSPGEFLRDLGELAGIQDSFPAIDLFAVIRLLAFKCGSS